MQEYLNYSKDESAFLGLAVGRGSFEKILVAELRDEIAKKEFDVLRIKVAAQNAYTVDNLEKIGFPFYHAGSIINYSIPLEKISAAPYDNPDISFERYDGTKSDLVKDIIKKSYQDDPIGYYKTPFLNQLITKEKELDFMANYYSQKFTTDEKQLYFVKEKEEYWGLVCYIVNNNVADSPLAAVYPDKWNKGALRHIKRERYNFALRNNIEYTTNGARLDNLASQRVFEKVGMKKVGVDHIFHVLPLLGSGGHVQTGEIKKDKDVYDYCRKLLNKHVETTHLQHLFTKTINISESTGEQVLSVNQSIPIDDDERLLAVTKLFTHSGLHKVIYLAYCR